MFDMDERFTWIELRSVAGDMRVSGTPHARFGHSVLDEHGDECGVCGGWRWEDGTLSIESDLHGYLPLYLHQTPDRVIVADSPLPILSRLDQRELDPVALGFFCRAGFLIGDRTLFQGICRVPACVRMTWQNGVFETELDRLAHPEPPSSIKEAVDGWTERFQVAIKRRLPDQDSFDLPLSGGRDSRMMLLELHRHGCHPRRVLSLGSPRSETSSDLNIASQISRRLGIPFQAVEHHEADWISTERARHVACGFEALEHVWLMPLWRELLSGGASWYDGLGVGSLTRNSAASPRMMDLLRRGDMFQWAKRFFEMTASTSDAWLDQIIAQAPFPIADADTVVSDLRQELNRHLEAPNPITSFTFENWGRRSISLNPFGICREQKKIQLPFMDRDLVAWTRSIPVDMTHQNDIQTEACHRLYPEFKDIPFDDGLPPRKPKASLWLRYRRRRQKALFFKNNAKYFGTLPARALDDSSDKNGSHRALVLMFHLASVDTLVTGH